MRAVGKLLTGLVLLSTTKRAGCIMLILDGYTHQAPRKIVSGCGVKKTDGYGQNKIHGPICGPIKLGTGYT